MIEQRALPLTGFRKTIVHVVVRLFNGFEDPKEIPVRKVIAHVRLEIPDLSGRRVDVLKQELMLLEDFNFVEIFPSKAQGLTVLKRGPAFNEYANKLKETKAK